MVRERVTRIVGLLLVVGVTHTWMVRAGEPSKATLKDLTWMVGDWRTEVEGDQLQESWSPAFGDSMIGTFRWVKRDGRTSLFEFLSITSDAGELAFRFRHFSRTLAAWEEKDAPLTFKLAGMTDREVVWENPQQKALTKLTYQLDGSGKLNVRIESQDKDGSPKKMEFHFVRAKGEGK